MTDYVTILSGGHPNSLGRTQQVVDEVLSDRHKLPALFNSLTSDDPVVRMRVGDALEKVARQQPDWFAQYVNRILDDMGAIEQPSIQWHVAQLLTEIPLTVEQRRKGIKWLWRTHDSTHDWIVISETLTALAFFAPTSISVRQKLPSALQKAKRDPRKAVARRADKLLQGIG